MERQALSNPPCPVVVHYEHAGVEFSYGRLLLLVLFNGNCVVMALHSSDVLFLGINSGSRSRDYALNADLTNVVAKPWCFTDSTRMTMIDKDRHTRAQLR